MTDDQCAERTAQAEKNEAFFRRRMIGVRNEECVLVEEHCLRFLKRHAVFPSICRILAIIPFESQLTHMQY